MNDKISIETAKPPPEIPTGTPAAPAPSESPLLKSDDASGVAQPPPETDPAVKDWIEKINQAGGGRVSWIIQTGECLTKAKAELGYGRWGLLFGPGGLKFGQRRAEMFMQIVRCPALKDPNNFSNLPSCWSVLYALGRVPSEALTHAIADGRVHPEMTLLAARELAKGHRLGTAGPADQPAGKSFDIDHRLRPVDRHLRREAARWPPADRPVLAEALREIALGFIEGRL